MIGSAAEDFKKERVASRNFRENPAPSYGRRGQTSPNLPIRDTLIRARIEPGFPFLGARKARIGLRFKTSPYGPYFGKRTNFLVHIKALSSPFPDQNGCLHDPGKRGCRMGRYCPGMGMIWGSILAYFLEQGNIRAHFCIPWNRTVLRAFFTNYIVIECITNLPRLRAPHGVRQVSTCPGVFFPDPPRGRPFWGGGTYRSFGKEEAAPIILQIVIRPLLPQEIPIVS